MRAVVDGKVVAESDAVIENSGYRYFPPTAVKLNLLEKAPRTARWLNEWQQVFSRLSQCSKEP